MKLNNTSYLAEPEAAVGIIKCLLPEESVLLIRRTQSDRDPWSGHYAFPGGRIEPQDATIYHTCVREVSEETGIDLVPQDLKTTLDAELAGRNVKAPLVVQPFIFQINERPELILETKEIDSYFWLSAKLFRDKRNHEITEVLPNMIRPVFPITDYYVWGFTYGLLCSILDFDKTTIANR